jgi:hypothetical protein
MEFWIGFALGAVFGIAIAATVMFLALRDWTK